MLSGYLFHFFGSTVALTSQALFIVAVIVCIGAAAGAVKRLRRKPTTAVKKSDFHDQVMDELKRFDEAIQRRAKGQGDQAIGAPNLPAEKSHTVAPSILDADRPQAEQNAS